MEAVTVKDGEEATVAVGDELQCEHVVGTHRVDTLNSLEDGGRHVDKGFHLLLSGRKQIKTHCQIKYPLSFIFQTHLLFLKLKVLSKIQSSQH